MVFSALQHTKHIFFLIPLGHIAKTSNNEEIPSMSPNYDYVILYKFGFWRELYCLSFHLKFSFGFGVYNICNNKKNGNIMTTETNTHRIFCFITLIFNLFLYFSLMNISHDLIEIVFMFYFMNIYVCFFSIIILLIVFIYSA